jgi:hypothetical protein
LPDRESPADDLPGYGGAVGFLRGDLDSVGRAFEAWRRSHAWFAESPDSFGVKSLTGKLDQSLPYLLPLNNRRERELLWECSAGDWVAYFDDRARSDALTATRGLCRVAGLSGVLVQCMRSWDSAETDLQLVVFERGETRRSVSVTREESSTFEQYGEPLAFEHVENYGHKAAARKFTESNLREYSASLGLRPWDEGFYGERGTLFADLRAPGAAQKWRGGTDIVLGPSVGRSGRASRWWSRRDPRG